MNWSGCEIAAFSDCSSEDLVFQLAEKLLHFKVQVKIWSGLEIASF